MAYHNHFEKHGLYRVFTDKISGDEILKSNLSLHGDPRFDDIRYVLNDFTEIYEYQVTEKDIRIIACIDDVATKSKNVLKIAIVATLESLLDWIHMYCDKMKNSPYECKIFESVDDAREWVVN